MKAGWLLLGCCATLAAAACVGAAAEHEAIGDDAYAAGRFADALAEYRLALVGRDAAPVLHAKAAAAALHAGSLVAAAEEYVALGREGGDSRVPEAADGLVRVADAAIEQGDRGAVAAALEGLQRVAPGRALGSFALQVAASLGDAARGPEALSVLLYAAGAAPSAHHQDSLMYVYGTALRRLGRCEDAAAVFESLARRERDPGVALGARDGLVQCALQLGQRSLDGNQPTVAEEWFRLAVTRGAGNAGVWRAYLGLGDVRFALGNVPGAIEAYEQARAGTAPGDSVYAIVAERLNLIGRAPGEGQ